MIAAVQPHVLYTGAVVVVFVAALLGGCLGWAASDGDARWEQAFLFDQLSDDEGERQ